MRGDDGLRAKFGREAGGRDRRPPDPAEHRGGRPRDRRCAEHAVSLAEGPEFDQLTEKPAAWRFDNPSVVCSRVPLAAATTLLKMMVDPAYRPRAAFVLPIACSRMQQGDRTGGNRGALGGARRSRAEGRKAMNALTRRLAAGNARQLLRERLDQIRAHLDAASARGEEVPTATLEQVKAVFRDRYGALGC